MDMRELALQRAMMAVEKEEDVTDAVDPEVDAKVRAHMQLHGCGACALCKEACCNRDEPRLPDLRLARYTCTSATCSWVICYFCANSFEELQACDKCGEAVIDHDDDEDDEDDDDDDDDDEDEDDDEDAEDEQHEGEECEQQGEVPSGRGGRGTSGRGVGRSGAQISGAKRDRTL